MKIKILTILFFSLIFSSMSRAQTSVKPAPAVKNILIVQNLEGKVFEFTEADLAKLARLQLKGTNHDGLEMQFEGVSVNDVLRLCGVKLGGGTMRGKRLAEYLVVEAKDNYKAVFSLTEFDPDFTDAVVLLADRADGKLLTEEYGPWYLIVPNEKKHGRWVREVVRLSVRTAEPSVPLTTGDAQDEEAIYEVVFRHILKSWYARTPKPTENYYLEIGEKKDPSDALIKKLGDLGTQLKKGSESFISHENGSIVLDKKTKKQGVLFSIYKFEWLNKDEAKVAAGEHEGNMGASSCTYRLRRENGKWYITGAASCVIS